MKRTLIISGIAVAAIGLSAGLAAASIPDSSGVIHACYQSPPPQHGANIQVIDTGNGGSCGGGMVALTWNQTGPAGQQGATGATGATGPAGPKATAQDVTSQQTLGFSNSGGTTYLETLDCPTGTMAINGGVMSAESAQAPDPGFTLISPGQATEQFAAESNSDGSQSLSLPRPVNNGASWRIQISGFPAAENNGLVQHEFQVIVTFYVVCE